MSKKPPSAENVATYLAKPGKCEEQIPHNRRPWEIIEIADAASVVRWHKEQTRRQPGEAEPRGLTEVANSQLRHALFRNGRSPEFLATTRDFRAGNNAVDFTRIDGKNLSQNAIHEQAVQSWTSNVLRLARYYPATYRPEIEALEAADSLRATFAVADGVVALPEKDILTFPSAFKRAYDGVNGAVRALADIYSPQAWTPQDAEDGGRNAVTLFRLYKKMGQGDRSAFKKAVDAFVSGLPADPARADRPRVVDAKNLKQYIEIDRRGGDAEKKIRENAPVPRPASGYCQGLDYID
jgi:hypothetical protein